jgi:sulfonate transport system substrate-binding protein
MRAVLVAVVSALALAFTLAACGGDDDGAAAENGSSEPIRFGYHTQLDNVPALLVMERGTAEDAGLAVEWLPFPSGTTSMNALVSGAVDVTVSTATPFVTASSKTNGEIVSLGLVQYNGRGVAVVAGKDSGVQDIAGLKGKKVGLYSGSGTFAVFTNKVAPEFGLEANKDYTVVDLPIDKLVAALTAGNIDAFVASDPYPILAESTGVGTILTDLSEWDPNPIFISVKKSFLEQRKADLEQLMSQVVAQQQFIAEDFEQATSTVRATLTRFQQEPTDEELTGMMENIDPIPFYSDEIPAYLDEVYSLAEERGDLTEHPEWSDILLDYFTAPATEAGLENPFE